MVMSGKKIYKTYPSLDGVSVKKIPIKTVTRKEIVPGVYGDVVVAEDKSVYCLTMVTQEEIREAAHILYQIAEAMEESK